MAALGAMYWLCALGALSWAKSGGLAAECALSCGGRSGGFVIGRVCGGLVGSSRLASLAGLYGWLVWPKLFNALTFEPFSLMSRKVVESNGTARGILESSLKVFVEFFESYVSGHTYIRFGHNPGHLPFVGYWVHTFLN